MSIRWEEVEVFDATDLDQNGMPGQRSYNSSAGTSVQAIADAQLIDGRLVAANSIGQFSRLKLILIWVKYFLIMLLT